MKKTLASFLIGAAITFVAQADIIYPDGHVQQVEPFQVKKFSRAVIDVALSPIEIPKAVTDVGEEEGQELSLQPLAVGIPRGIYKMFLRLGDGAYDLATLGENNRRPWHVEPDNLGFRDLLPGYNNQFSWESLDSPATRMDDMDAPSWH